MARAPVPYSALLRAFVRVGLESFGGPAGQIAVLHRVLVQERGWLDERRFLHALNFCLLLPGPEAMQLATYTGWLLGGVRGGLTAGFAFVLPGFACVGLLSWTYARWSALGPVAALFDGLQPAVLAIVVGALGRVASRALHGRLAWALAAGAFVALFALALPFPLVVLGAGLVGLVAERARPGSLVRLEAQPALDAGEADRPSVARSLRTLARGLVVWLGPLAALALLEPEPAPFRALAGFVTTCALVTFGGAYAVLAYVAQEAVHVHGWLSPAEMLDGLGLAETTPGPLVLVLEYVGFLAGWRAGPSAHGLAPALGGWLGALVVGWATFAPCFVWIFVGAPWVEVLRGRRAWSGALAAITAAVVGVIASLASWFALHVLFAEVTTQRVGPLLLPVPRLASGDPWAASIAALALLAVLRWRVGTLPVIGAAALAGLALELAGAR